MCVNSKKISAWSSACLAQCAAYSTLSSDIFSNQMCGKKKTPPGALTFEWLVYTERTQRRQARQQPFSCSVLKYKLTRMNTYFFSWCKMTQKHDKGTKVQWTPTEYWKKAYCFFFLGVKHSLYKNKITGALECLGTVPSIMSGTKHIICTLCTTKWVKSQ